MGKTDSTPPTYNDRNIPKYYVCQKCISLLSNISTSKLEFKSFHQEQACDKLHLPCWFYTSIALTLYWIGWGFGVFGLCSAENQLQHPTGQGMGGGGYSIPVRFYGCE